MKEYRYSSGVYGTIRIPSNSAIIINKGADISASTDINDYIVDENSVYVETSENEKGRSLFYAKGKENFVIEGKKDSTINGNGTSWHDGDDFLRRPGLIRLVDCKNVVIKDLTLLSSPCWSISLHNCENVTIERVQIVSLWCINNYGIDIDCCRHVTINDCVINTYDDAVVLKSTKNISAYDINVSNCNINSQWAAFKIGTESVGDISDVCVKNIVGEWANGCIVKIVPTDGGSVRNVQVSDVSFGQSIGLVFVANGERNWSYYKGETSEKFSTIQDVQLKRIKVKHAIETKLPNPFIKGCVFISGTKRRKIKNVLIEDCEFAVSGGEEKEENIGKGIRVEELKEQYPEYYTLGVTPAYGAYLRHVDKAVLSNVKFNLQKPDVREEIVAVDVSGFLRNEKL